MESESLEILACLLADSLLPQVDFEMVDLGSAFANIISSGDGESDLYLTYTVSENLPHLQEGDPEAIEKTKAMEGLTVGAVKMSIEHIREAVVEGREL